MSLEPGTRIGPYEIAGPIGAGGMGEVYRAVDKTLGREVAIKVLPASLASDRDRIARFEQEAKTLAALNHANIASIYGLERIDGRAAIVMELVEGPTLAERIAAGPIPVTEAMDIAMQLIAALEAAHGRQIVHRDLKPQNIVLKDDGTVSVLDFGIAKAFESLPTADSGESPVLTTPVTQAGVVLGTAAYMSPEQARGRLVDQRSDIWAFGCVVYEMLTGQMAFGGEDVPITLARVLAKETDFDSLPAMIAPAVRRTLRLCLEKDLKKRVADIRDVRLAFEGAFETIASAPLAADRARWRWPAVVAVALPLAVVASIGAWSFKPEPPARLARTLVSDARAPFVPTSFDENLAMSPDGSRVAYRSREEGRAYLFVRRLDELDATELVDDSNIRSVFFSPDSREIGYSDGFTLYRISVNGGSPAVIIEGLGGSTRGATWGPDGTIVYATGAAGGLSRVRVDGGSEPEVLTTPGNDSDDHWWPEFMPDGSAVLFSIVSNGDAETARIAVQALDGSEPRVLVPQGSSPHYVDTGHIVYAIGNALWAVGFDPKALEVTTEPFPVVQNVHITSYGASSFGVSNEGSLVYARGDVVTGQNELQLVHRDGRVEALQYAPDDYSTPRLSPDRTRIAVSIGLQDVWVGDLRSGSGRWNPVTTSKALDNVPIWSPDSAWIVFASQREGTDRYSFFRKSSDGTGAAVKLLDSLSSGQFKPYQWTADGALLFDYGLPASLDIGLLQPGGNGTWDPVIVSDVLESTPSLSRDGAWIAYTTDLPGRCEVYVERFPTRGNRTPIDIGSQSLWSPTSDELYYREGPRLLAVSFDPATGVVVGEPEVIVNGLDSPDCFWRDYDVSADGESILVLKPAASESGLEGTELVLVQNWFQELERLVPTD
jgi:serine/threonine-protein kinase